MLVLRNGLSSLRHTVTLVSLRSADKATAPSVMGSISNALCASPFSSTAPLRCSRHISCGNWSSSSVLGRAVAVEKEQRMLRGSAMEDTLLRRRSFCTGMTGGRDPEPPQSQPQSQEDAVGEMYEYEAPFWKPLKRVKLLSISSLFATMTSVPIMFALQNSAAFSGRIGAVMTVGVFSLFTTGMLHWFSSPYVCFLRHRKGSDAVEVETCSFVASKKIRNFTFAQMETPDGSLRPLVTFAVKGTPFYIDEKHFQYQEVLKHIPKSEEEIETEAESEAEAEAEWAEGEGDHLNTSNASVHTEKGEQKLN